MDNKILYKSGATQMRFQQKKIKVDTSILYSWVVGSLLRLANGSRPDISFAVSTLLNTVVTFIFRDLISTVVYCITLLVLMLHIKM